MRPFLGVSLTAIPGTGELGVTHECIQLHAVCLRFSAPLSVAKPPAIRQISEELMVTRTRETYSNSRVPLDGHEYKGCSFRSCTFVYLGGSTFSLRQSDISPDCRLEFGGAAANTVATMQAIYRMGDWGKQHILATFQQIAPGLEQLN